MKLTEHFEVEEFRVSATYPDVARKMIMTSSNINSLYLLCLFLLEPIREKFGIVQVHSGFRSHELNTLLKGACNSQHLLGEAADIVCPLAPSMTGVFMYVCDELKWKGEVVYYPRRGHVHVAMPRFQVTADHFINAE